MNMWVFWFNLTVAVFNIFVALYISHKNSNTIKPKFKVGQSVWVIDGNMIYPLRIYKVTYLMNPEKVSIAYFFEKSGFAPATQNQVFATRKKAEKALAKRRGAQ